MKESEKAAEELHMATRDFLTTLGTFLKGARLPALERACERYSQAKMQEAIVPHDKPTA